MIELDNNRLVLTKVTGQDTHVDHGLDPYSPVRRFKGHSKGKTEPTSLMNKTKLPMQGLRYV